MSESITYIITPGSDERWNAVFQEFPDIERLEERIYGVGEDAAYDLDIHLRGSMSNPFSIQEFIPGTPMRSAIEQVLCRAEDDRGE